MAGEGDFLDVDASTQVRADQQAKAIEFAQLYKLFEDDARGRELLAHWVEAVEQRDVPPAASHQEYAFWEGRRSFIRGIQRQVILAKQGK